jgi:leucine dehydrogenase
MIIVKFLIPKLTYNEFMKFFKKPIFHNIIGYETVMEFSDLETHLHGFIAIHNTKRGPALGGTRLWHYPSPELALTDVLRLAKGMTYKAAGADLALGGGKAVLIGDAHTIKSPAYFEAYGHYVNELKGTYITAEDINTTPADMRHIAKQTQHVVGTEGKSGNPSPWTSLGVFVGIQAAIPFAFSNKSIDQLTFAVQGVGQTGTYLVDHLIKAQAKKIYVTDVNPHHLSRIKNQYPSIVIVPEADFLTLPVDVLCPCALGGIIHQGTIPTIQARLIAGSANNLLLNEQNDGPLAHQKGIWIAPDFIINAGGLINVYHEHMADYEADKIRVEVEKIGDRITSILATSVRENIDPFLSAQLFVANQLK